MNRHDEAQTPASDLELPDAHALLADTLALMSAWAHPNAHALVDTATLRGVLHKKIVSNLFFMLHHPALDPPMRQVARNLYLQWRTHTPDHPEEPSLDTSASSSDHTALH